MDLLRIMLRRKKGEKTACWFSRSVFHNFRKQSKSGEYIHEHVNAKRAKNDRRAREEKSRDFLQQACRKFVDMRGQIL